MRGWGALHELAPTIGNHAYGETHLGSERVGQPCGEPNTENGHDRKGRHRVDLLQIFEYALKLVQLRSQYVREEGQGDAEERGNLLLQRRVCAGID
eukprot:5274915-Pyramimonas_sp.AAC.1